MRQLLFKFILVILVITCSCNSSQKINKEVLNSKDFNFFVLGDWGRDGKFYQKDVAEQMIVQAKKYDPAFIMLTGDNFYDDGVANTADKHWKASYENIYKELTKNYQWLVCLGNHDYRGSVQAQIDYHLINKNWILPSRYYTKVVETKDHQKVRLICIDTSPYYSEYYSLKTMTAVKMQDTALQRKWIDSTLAASKEPWKIVFGHHPVYSAAKRGGTPELVKMLEPMLEKYHVQAYICGHDHNLQHTHSPKGDVDYFISGGGSEVKDSPVFTKSNFAESKAGFADVTIKADSLFINYIDKDGNVLYKFGRGK